MVALEELSSSSNETAAVAVDDVVKIDEWLNYARVRNLRRSLSPAQAGL